MLSLIDETRDLLRIFATIWDKKTLMQSIKFAVPRSVVN